MAAYIPRNDDSLSPPESGGNSTENHGLSVPHTDTSGVETLRRRSWTGYNDYSERCRACKKVFLYQPLRTFCMCPCPVQPEANEPTTSTASTRATLQATSTFTPQPSMAHQPSDPLVYDTSAQWAQFASHLVSSLGAQLAAQGFSGSMPPIYIVFQNNMNIVGDSVVVKTGIDNSYVDKSHDNTFVASGNASMNVRAGFSNPA